MNKHDKMKKKFLKARKIELVNEILQEKQEIDLRLKTQKEAIIDTRKEKVSQRFVAIYYIKNGFKVNKKLCGDWEYYKVSYK